MLTPCQLFKALADDTRLRCLLLLHKQGRLCVCELTCALELPQPKISRHLAQMRQTGLLLASRDGQWVHYQIHPALPAWALAILEVVAGQAGDGGGQQADWLRLQAYASSARRVACR